MKDVRQERNELDLAVNRITGDVVEGPDVVLDLIAAVLVKQVVELKDTSQIADPRRES